MKKILGIFTAALFGGFVAIGTDRYLISPETAVDTGFQERGLHQGAEHVSYSPGIPAETAENFTHAAEMSVNAVVHVKSSYAAESNGEYYDPFHDFLWGPSRPQAPQQQASFGSGVIISGDGYIVTNNHVIDKADKIEITLNDRRSYSAELIGRDPSTDLALLKIKEHDLPYIPYGNSDDTKVGEWVLAVGNPFNLTSTVTAGIVSAKGRNINILSNNQNRDLYAIESFIQTDAAVNRGNSGGALVNTTGQLIGINSAIFSPTGAYNGYSFAIPVNIVKKVMADLIEFGKVQRAFIGVSIRDIDAGLAKEKDIAEIRGVYVNGLTEGGSAREAGVETGDVITKVAGIDVASVSQLQEQISKYRPGDKVNLTVKRKNKSMIVPIVLKNRSGTTALMEKERAPEVESAMGAIFEIPDKDEMKRLNIENGLKITRLGGGKLRSAGIQEGFIITSIDKKKVNNMADLREILDNKKGGVLIEGVYPNGMRAYYGFGL